MKKKNKIKPKVESTLFLTYKARVASLFSKITRMLLLTSSWGNSGDKKDLLEDYAKLWPTSWRLHPPLWGCVSIETQFLAWRRGVCLVNSCCPHDYSSYYDFDHLSLGVRKASLESLTVSRLILTPWCQSGNEISQRRSFTIILWPSSLLICGGANMAFMILKPEAD